MKKGIIITIVLIICLCIVAVAVFLTNNKAQTKVDIIALDDVEPLGMQANENLYEANASSNTTQTQEDVIKTLTLKISGLNKTVKINFTDEQYEEYQKNGLFSKLDLSTATKENILKYLQENYNTEIIE